MTIRIVIVLLVGVFAGNLMPLEFAEKLNSISFILLCFILFFAGLTIGYTGDIKSHVRGIGLDLVMVPISTIIGTFLGSYIASFIIGLDYLECLLVGSGFGWYSLSAVMIAEYDQALGAVSFMSNVFREILALMFIPLVAKYIGFNEAVTLGGATSGDTTMPPLSKTTDTRTVIIAFFSGIVFAFVVPVSVEFLIALKYK